jgi:microcystin-dependent protein
MITPLLCALASFALCVSLAAAESPTFIPFQGRITDQAGNTYTNLQYTILFQLYNQAVGGQAAWQERHDKVGVVNGLVNVFLGSINPLTSVDFSSTKHLGITIDADNNPITPEPEMIPRQMIIPAFWAKNSERLAGQDWTPLFGTNSPLGPLPAAKIQSKGITAGQIAADAVGTEEIAADAVLTANIAAGQVTKEKLSPDLQAIINQMTPAGTISAFGGTNLPAGWLPCDGRALNSTQYPILYAAISTNWGAGIAASTNDFNLPDLRGLFLRGVTGSRTNQWADPDWASRTNVASFGGRGGNRGNNVGSLQVGAIESHRHTFSAVTGGSANTTASGIQHQFESTGGNPTSYAGGLETRPKNAYVNYIIKY